MKNKLLALALLFAVGFTACKNKDIDVEGFMITKEKALAGSTAVTITGSFSFGGTINGMTANLGADESLATFDSYAMEVVDNEFTVTIEGLQPGTTYYYRLSADFGMSNDYITETSSFVTLQVAPTVSTIEVIQVDSTTFRVSCRVLTDGGSSITERGVCWNSYGNPNLDDAIVKHNMSSLGDYSCQISGLATGTTYFARAYAKNEEQTGYGEVLQFRTSNPATYPSVTTAAVTEVSAIAAICGGTVVDEGYSQVSSRGICWSTEHNPTINDIHTTDGSGLGTFVSHLTGLVPNTEYFVRAYATNTKGTAYGDEVSFTALEGLPEVETLEVTELGDDFAIGHGKVTDEGASPVVERGLCWGLNHNPDLTNFSEHNGQGMGSFDITMNDIIPNKTYYVRAYAKNTQGVVYGIEKSFIIEKNMEVPTIVTDSVGSITQTSAIAYGTLIDDGGADISDMGVCWGTSMNPTISDHHVSVDLSMSSFLVTIDHLSPSTTYHVRAYAVNEIGISYGNDIDFSTKAPLVNLPTVTTNDVTDVTQNSAVCGGFVSSDGGAAVMRRGLCWSTHQNPTIDDNHTVNGSGTGVFTGEVVGLLPGATYYIKAYATNSAGTSYGGQKMFSTIQRPEGALDGLFSVGDGHQVWFSQGNLQYLASTNTWSFANSQEVYAGADNGGMQSNYDKWIDLFGWGTSNYPHGANKYEPWSTSSTNSDYYAYGQAAYHLYDQTGKADWGYNPISNGGNQENMGWRTLSYSEWDYLLTQRQTPSNVRFVKAVVKGVNGLIILPDEWNNAVHAFSPSSINSASTSYGTNTLTDAEWNVVESAGAVFLPAGGSRYGRTTNNIGTVGYYWSASNKGGSVTAYYLYFTTNEVKPTQDSGRCYGRIVRLVKDKP